MCPCAPKECYSHWPALAVDARRLQDLFRDRDCVTIVRPVADEGDLRNIQKLPYESLRPQFREQVRAL